MRNFINWLITIALFITIIITIIVFTISNLTTEKSTKYIINNIDYKTVVEEFKNSNYSQSIYDYAKDYGISESQVDTLLQTEEFKKYSNELIQSIIDSYLNDKNIEISNNTNEFINDINKKYELNLDLTAKEKIKNYINNTVDENVNTITINNSNNNESANIIISIIKACKDVNVHIVLFIIIFFLTACLFLCSWKTKNFLEYISITAITIGISTLLFNGVIFLIINYSTKSLTNIKIILAPITNFYYTISIISIITGIILIITQHFINKKIINKEVVPF